MAWGFIQSNVGESGGGTPKVATVGLTSISGTDVGIIVKISARTTVATGWTVSVTWNGVAMTQAHLRDANLNGFGSGKSYQFYLPIGTVSGLTANAVATASNSESTIAIICTVAAYSGMDQVTMLNDTADFAVITSATNISVSVNSDADDLIIGNACFAETAAGAAATPLSGQTKLPSFSTSTGSAVSQASGYDNGGTPTTAQNWGGFNSAYTYTLCSYVASTTPAGPIITDVDGDDFIDPDESPYTLNGTDLAPAGVTALYYADSSDFGTALLVLQPISAVTSTSLTWDTFVPGQIGEGDNYLFIVTDEGGGGELISPAFPLLAGGPEAFVQRVVYQCTGSESGTVLVGPVDFDNPTAAVIRSNGCTLDNVLQNDSSYSLCFVDMSTSMGMGMGSSDDPAAHQRGQKVGMSSLFIFDGGSGPHLVEGTPSIGASGLTIDFTLSTAGINLEIVIFGGSSVKAKVVNFEINDGSVTGLGFEPDVLMCSTAGITFGSPGDSSFAILSWGVALGTNQFLMSSIQSSTNRNSYTKSGAIISQLTGASIAWEMAITSFDSDGFSWSGADGDEAYGLAIRFPGRQLFLTVFNKTSTSTPGVTQSLPDIGFEPGAIFLASTGRNNQTESPVLGARWSIGVVTTLGQDVSMNQCLPPSGTIVCEQLENQQDVVTLSSNSGVIEVRGRITNLAQVSTIQWVDNFVDSGIAIGMFAIDSVLEDDGGACVMGEFTY